MPEHGLDGRVRNDSKQRWIGAYAFKYFVGFWNYLETDGPCIGNFVPLNRYSDLNSDIENLVDRARPWNCCTNSNIGAQGETRAPLSCRKQKFHLSCLVNLPRRFSDSIKGRVVTLEQRVRVWTNSIRLLLSALRLVLSHHYSST